MFRYAITPRFTVQRMFDKVQRRRLPSKWRKFLNSVGFCGVLILLIAICCFFFFSCIALGRILVLHDFETGGWKSGYPPPNPLAEYGAAFLATVPFILLCFVCALFGMILMRDFIGAERFESTWIRCLLGIIGLLGVGIGAVAISSNILESERDDVVMKKVIVHYVVGYLSLLLVLSVLAPVVWIIFRHRCGH
ncbi:hypothetical protein DL96DRAFT_348017 [Flagelloscypha sp. PMI_526]|nr:hypothetical protein DL96DRAFT_348017 [Flagelloscypha sp. PMI_526]